MLNTFINKGEDLRIRVYFPILNKQVMFVKEVFHSDMRINDKKAITVGRIN